MTMAVAPNIEVLNLALAEAEQRLRTAAPRVAAEVALEPGYTLCYSKVDGEWCLWVRDESKEKNERGSWSMLGKASREHRILAAHQLGALFDAVLANESALEADVVTAIEAARAFQPTRRS